MIRNKHESMKQKLEIKYMFNKKYKIMQNLISKEKQKAKWNNQHIFAWIFN